MRKPPSSQVLLLEPGPIRACRGQNGLAKYIVDKMGQSASISSTPTTPWGPVRTPGQFKTALGEAGGRRLVGVAEAAAGTPRTFKPVVPAAINQDQKTRDVLLRGLRGTRTRSVSWTQLPLLRHDQRIQSWRARLLPPAAGSCRRSPSPWRAFVQLAHYSPTIPDPKHAGVSTPSSRRSRRGREHSWPGAYDRLLFWGRAARWRKRRASTPTRCGGRPGKGHVSRLKRSRFAVLCTPSTLPSPLQGRGVLTSFPSWRQGPFWIPSPPSGGRKGLEGASGSR